MFQPIMRVYLVLPTPPINHCCKKITVIAMQNIVSLLKKKIVFQTKRHFLFTTLDEPFLTHVKTANLNNFFTNLEIKKL